MTGTVLTNNLHDLSVSVTVADGNETGGCYVCGKQTEWPDHNTCQNCLEAALGDLGDCEVFEQ